MNKITLLCIGILVSTSSFSQISPDYLVTEEGDTIHCKILALEGLKLTYLPSDKKSDKSKSIFNFKDIKISNPEVIVNPLNIKIEAPEVGFASVYFYRPYSYTGSALPCNVDYNGKKIVNIKTNSYHLQKVKANEIHVFNPSISKRDKVEIQAKDGEIYFVQAGFGGNNVGGMVYNSMSLFLDNPNIAKYAILNMKKESTVLVESTTPKRDSFPRK